MQLRNNPQQDINMNAAAAEELAQLLRHLIDTSEGATGLFRYAGYPEEKALMELVHQLREHGALDGTILNANYSTVSADEAHPQAERFIRTLTTPKRERVVSARVEAQPFQVRLARAPYDVVLHMQCVDTDMSRDVVYVTQAHREYAEKVAEHVNTSVRELLAADIACSIMNVETDAGTTHSPKVFKHHTQDMDVTTFVNDRGNVCESTFINDGVRYDYDCHLMPAGFKQYDTHQDAPYFGVWVHLEHRTIVTFAEGDLTAVTCLTHEQFVLELNHMSNFYGAAPPAFTCIDTGSGTVTKHYDRRPHPLCPVCDSELEQDLSGSWCSDCLDASESLR